MHIIFDLDRTLFDTDKLKQDLIMALAGFGVSRKIFLKTYQEVVNRQPGKYDYSYLAHLKLLDRHFTWSGARLSEAKKSIRAVLKNDKNYLLPFALETLRGLKQAGHTLILWTWGNQALHKSKIKSTGIEKYFSRIEITSLNKTLVLDKFLSSLPPNRSDLVFVNDSLQELAAFLAYAPQVKVILKISPGHAQDAKAALKLKMPAFKDLRQIESFIRHFPSRNEV